MSTTVCPYLTKKKQKATEQKKTKAIVHNYSAEHLHLETLQNSQEKTINKDHSLQSYRPHPYQIKTQSQIFL